MRERTPFIMHARIKRRAKQMKYFSHDANMHVCTEHGRAIQSNTACRHCGSDAHRPDQHQVVVCVQVCRHCSGELHAAASDPSRCCVNAFTYPLHHIHAPANSQTAQQLVAQGLSLGNSAQTAVSDLLSVQLNAVSGEAEPLLHNGGQLADAAALLTCSATQ